jgi:hypothetical protein
MAYEWNGVHFLQASLLPFQSAMSYVDPPKSSAVNHHCIVLGLLVLGFCLGTRTLMTYLPT